MKLLIALVAALSMSTASAGVAYQWKSTMTGPEYLPHGLEFNITFTDAAFRAGGADYSYRAYCPSTDYLACATDLNSPIEHMYFLARAGHPDPVEYTPSDPGLRGFGYLDMSFTFLPDGYISGWISASNTGTEFRMGNGRFAYVASDYPIDQPGCVSLWECSGATGELRAVPEPSSIALLLLGAAAMIRRSGPTQA